MPISVTIMPSDREHEEKATSSFNTPFHALLISFCRSGGTPAVQMSGLLKCRFACSQRMQLPGTAKMPSKRKGPLDQMYPRMKSHTSQAKQLSLQVRSSAASLNFNGVRFFPPFDRRLNHFRQLGKQEVQ